MKAVLVIDMPSACDECKFETEMLNCGKPMCVATPYRRERIEDDSTRPSWCPLRPLPEGHGDLIDRKALIENGLRKGFCDWYDEIKMADAIIESDKGETE